MFFGQVLRGDIGCAAYVVGSTDAGEAAVIDPRIDMVDEILAIAEREGLRIRYVIETHNHADHVAGHHEIARHTGATIAVHQDAGVAYPHLALRHGDELALGEVRLRILHTPGHRPEHIAIAVIDTSRGEEPWLALTGDSLFIGDVARPDLAVPGQEGAARLFESLRDTLLSLPDGVMAYPAHVAGSLCGRVTNRMTSTTIGFERRHNPALAITSRERFVRFMNESLPERPPNLARIVALNMAAEPLHVGRPEPLSPADALRLREDGAVVLDIRSVEEYAAGHIPDAVAVQFDGSQFPNRVGLVIPPDSRLVLVVSADEQAPHVAEKLAVVGFDKVAGYLDGGMASWIAAGYGVTTMSQARVEDALDLLRSDTGAQMVDVREQSEFAAGHVAGAIHIPFHHLTERLGQLDRARPVALICASGHRSAIGASLLERAGFARVINVTGGMNAWRATRLPLADESRLASAAIS